MANKVLNNAECVIKYSIGTMIELPRAALMAGEIANDADYFSFGTNDLTQTTFGISRDDVASFMPEYLSKKLFPNDPFVTLDQDGVGELIKIAIERGIKTNPGLKIGVCGEHAGDPASIEFFHKVGANYVSCSPYRVPIAKIAAAHAAIKSGK
jgi:pyruvate,orthophosphate dikinase